MDTLGIASDVRKDSFLIEVPQSVKIGLSPLGFSKPDRGLLPSHKAPLLTLCIFVS